MLALTHSTHLTHTTHNYPPTAPLTAPPHFSVFTSISCQKPQDVVHRKIKHSGIVHIVQPRVLFLGCAADDPLSQEITRSRSPASRYAFRRCRYLRGKYPSRNENHRSRYLQGLIGSRSPPYGALMPSSPRPRT